MFVINLWRSKWAAHSATDALKLGSTGEHAANRSTYAAPLSSIRSGLGLIFRKTTKTGQAHHHTPQYAENGSWALEDKHLLLACLASAYSRHSTHSTAFGTVLKAFLSTKHRFTVTAMLRAAVLRCLRASFADFCLLEKAKSLGNGIQLSRECWSFLRRQQQLSVIRHGDLQ